MFIGHPEEQEKHQKLIAEYNRRKAKWYKDELTKWEAQRQQIKKDRVRQRQRAYRRKLQKEAKKNKTYQLNSRDVVQFLSR